MKFKERSGGGGVGVGEWGCAAGWGGAQVVG